MEDPYLRRTISLTIAGLISTESRGVINDESPMRNGWIAVNECYLVLIVGMNPGLGT